MGAVARRGWGALGLTDILAGHAADERQLAHVYDLEHDGIVEDHAFYRERARRQPGRVADLGCGSGRLFEPLLTGGAEHVLGVDGSPALLERAERRIESNEPLRAARAAGRIELIAGDLGTIRRKDRYSLVILAGVLAHLDGPAAAREVLAVAAGLLTTDGALIVDGLGPGSLPARDLPLSVDWERWVEGRRIVRRSMIERQESDEGLRVTYGTVTDLEEADGTIARLPATFRLWYPSPSGLFTLADEAGLEVDVAYGSHDLDPLAEGSDRCIAVMRRATASGKRVRWQAG